MATINFYWRRSALLLGAMCVMMVSCNRQGQEIEEQDQEMVADTLMTQRDMNQYVWDKASKYKDSVDMAYTAFLGRMGDIYKKEAPYWNKYYEAADAAYEKINMGGSCGSSAPMGFASFDMDVQRQHLVSFSETAAKHAVVTDAMIGEEYEHFLTHGTGIHAYGEADYTDEEKHDALKKEQEMWNEWMAIRGEIAKQLTGAERKIYENQTNEVKRMKLIQLKNQYEEYGVNSESFFEIAVLDRNCTDKQLREWTRCDEKLEAYRNKD